MTVQLFMMMLFADFQFAHAHNTRPVCYPEKVVAERRRYLYKMRLWRKGIEE